MIDIEALLKPISEESPCGPALDYDAAFAELEKAALGEPERQSGKAVVPAKAPVWSDVRQRGQQLFGRTKDLRVAVALGRGLVWTERLEGFAATLTLIDQLLTRYWDSIHPLLESDEDATLRINALAALSDPETFLGDVRRIKLLDTGALGSLTVRDVLISQGKLPPSAGAARLSAAEIRKSLQAATAADLSISRSASAASQALNSMLDQLEAKLGSDQRDEFGRLLDTMVGLNAALAGEAAPPPAIEGRKNSPPPQVSAGEIQTREDAVRQLERICEFIQRMEPANPAPLLIRRAQRLMTKNFVEIIEDLAPASLAEIQKIAGIESKG